METLVQLIFIIALANYSLKAALSGNLIWVAGYAVLVAIIAFALYPIVIQQPLTIITEMLSDRRAVETMALLTTAEAIMGILIAICLIDNYFKHKVKRSSAVLALRIMPSILLFFAIAYFELLFFKFRVGSDFLSTAAIFSALLSVGIFCVSLLFRFTLLSESFKLEIKIVFNLVILIAGLLISSSVADYNTSQAQHQVEWGALCSLMVITIILVVTGFWFEKIDIKKLLKKQQ